MPMPPCDRCRLPECLCGLGEPRRCAIDVVIYRHTVERHKMSGTARLIPMAVTGARIVDVGGSGAAPRTSVDEAFETGTYLLFPGGRTIRSVSGIVRLVVPDGTWSQTRRMRTRVPALASLPTVSVPLGPATLRLRDPRRPDELATAVAVARALESLGECSGAAQLLLLYERMHEMLTRRDSRRTQEFR